jgi:hypothetical protein
MSRSDPFYSDMAGLALEIIDEFQQGVLELERQTPVEGDKPWEPQAPDIQRFPVVGVVQAIDRRLVDGTTVLATDRLAILPVNSLPASVIPELSDVLIVDGTPTVIKKIIRVPEAGIVIVYRLVIGS